MINISQKRLLDYRASTYLTLPGKRLASPGKAIDFVNERGFIFLWPIKNVVLPSLWNAVAGDRPVPNEHDDPGHISWEWKDQLLDKRVWYYGRILKHKNTLASLKIAPYFYALTPNFGSPEEDFQEQYQRGILPLESKLIFEALVKEGPLDTISLRKAAHLTRKSSDAPFNRALDLLQMDMRCLPVSISAAGRWHYAFVYDLTHRYYPDLPEKARLIGENHARQELALAYLLSVGMATVKSISSLFHWSSEASEKCLLALETKGGLIVQASLENCPDAFFAIKDLS